MKTGLHIKRIASVVVATVLVLVATGCPVETAKNRVGTTIDPVMNAIPVAGEKLGKFCTAYNPDPSMHQHTIAQLVESHTPFILVFGTPSHCTQCQNQLDTVKHYRDTYDRAFEVVHIDQYKNSQIYTDLKIAGDPWTFLIDGDAVIQAIYPGVTTWDDLSVPLGRMIGADKVKKGAVL